MVKFLPPKNKCHMNKKTLVLDLDETLVHSGFRPFGVPSDIILKIELDNRIHDIHVLVRPGVEEFLERMSKHYELVVFTASLSKVKNKFEITFIYL
jgi:RNA polymerase II subunit A small phosphatase-like protein